MTKGEDAKRGNLTVTLEYEKIAQDIKCAIHFLQKLSDRLDMAAIEKGIIERERRNGDRRNKKADDTRPNQKGESDETNSDNHSSVGGTSRLPNN